MSDISLTASMRTNLLSLQQTTTLLGRTQERLSSGKKVNSALDNPTNFFASQSLNNRATDLLGFKDSIGQAIQTIKAADNAIKGITTLIQSAKAVANDAKSVVSENQTSQTLTINTTTGLSAAETIIVGGVTLTAISGVATCATMFDISSGDTTQIAISLAAAVNAGTTYNATLSGNELTITDANGTAMAAGTILFSRTDLGDLVATGAVFSESDIGGGSTELTAKISQYNTLMDQLDDLQADAFYAGKNLLDGTTVTLSVKFGNNHSLDISGFDGSATGLGLTTSATGAWGSEAQINTFVDDMDAALSTLQVQSGSLASNLSIVNARDLWITDITNTLTTGSDKLVLADSNEEGANMLMLQTRQSLGTTSLSLASQQAQSVLRLFG